jgi:hypothetical protein
MLGLDNYTLVFCKQPTHLILASNTLEAKTHT